MTVKKTRPCIGYNGRYAIPAFSMKTAIFISGHYYASKRKAGFHWLADSLWRQGWRVIFVTAPVSWLSWARRDHRHQYPIREEANRMVRVAENLESYVWWTPWHPANLRSGLLDRLASGLYRKYHELPLGPLEDEAKTADLFVYESTPALPLFERFSALNPNARAVYRVSDDIRTLNMHPMLSEVERRIAPQFDMISSPTALIHEKFSHLAHAQLQPHGVPVNLYAAADKSPYDTSDGLDHVFVGIARLDNAFIEIASAARPADRFHIIGPVGPLPRRDNVIAYGELPFEETVPYVRHADIGLHILERSPGVEVFRDSLKVVQYSWCRLPIVAPCFLRSARPNVACYERNDTASITDAIERAAQLQPNADWADGIDSWDDVARTLTGERTATEDRAAPIPLPFPSRVGA